MTEQITDVRTILIITPNEEILLDVPASWKITFGPFNPGSPQRDQPTNGASLRIYEAKDKQRACFTNVIQFRDLSMNLRKRERAVDINGKKVKLSMVDSEGGEFEPEEMPPIAQTNSGIIYPNTASNPTKLSDPF